MRHAPVAPARAGWQPCVAAVAVGGVRSNERGYFISEWLQAEDLAVTFRQQSNSAQHDNPAAKQSQTCGFTRSTRIVHRNVAGSGHERL